MKTVTKSNPERDFFSFMSKRKKVCRCFASFSSEQEHFTHGMYMTALIHPLDIKNEPIMFYEAINAKVFRTNKGCLDIKLKKSRSGFDLVTAFISKQSFFQHCVWPLSKVNHIFME